MPIYENQDLLFQQFEIVYDEIEKFKSMCVIAHDEISEPILDLFESHDFDLYRLEEMIQAIIEM